ncbi:MAG: intradiol ring-cleavage dioxygenase [Candidatus Eisenbacteria bacterium]|uniref:Intradiol ring-cleavage dioxygenase n=1 Tax=Eiseniibacteriota bacterium TaxID=2212470 RepID=A0A7Y2H1Y4_UNCEI|nr:intradiol ring-cleavage dioxygenase [Candidatus Eisenbacteria bacterium]
MHDDDGQVGWVLSRRQVLACFGAAGATLLSGGVPLKGPARVLAADCIARPAQAAGPYFVDDMLNRSDIRSDPSDQSISEGAEFNMTFRVSRFSGEECEPLAGVVVDLWHCDAAGVYSGVVDPNFNTVGKSFLRGLQIANSDGEATFTTIYPGWYPGRAVHFHFKIRSPEGFSPAFDFTSQLYFNDIFTDQVFQAEPYASRGLRTVRNSGDGIFNFGGSELLLDVTEEGGVYQSTFDLALDVPTPSKSARWGQIKKL